jgi:RHS repeat-associated protein
MTQIAVRTIEGESDELNWILTDHLSSASVSASADGTLVSEVKYSAYGEIRPIQGTLPTDYQYTGQLSQMDEIGLMYFVARWADPLTGHFVQADTIVPSAGNAKDFNRYAYGRYNPLAYVDPSGHAACRTKEDCEDMGTTPMGKPPAIKISTGTNDKVSLGKMCSTTACYTGAQMKQLHNVYKAANYNDDFSVIDFLIDITAHEMASNLYYNETWQGRYSYAISEKYSYWCSEYSSANRCDGVSENAIYNYIATRGSAWMLYDSYITFENPFKPMDENWLLNISVAEAVVLDALGNIKPKAPNGANIDWGNEYDEKGIASLIWTFEDYAKYDRVIKKPPHPAPFY